MFTLRAEEKTILSLARRSPAKQLLEETAGLIAAEGTAFDYHRLISLAEKNEVAPLLYKNLKQVAGVPEKVLQDLKPSYHRTVAANTLNGRALLKILTSLKAAGIEAMPLKGALASEIIFENPGLYPAGDIDLLVKPSDLSETARLLTEAGYVKTEAFSECDLLAHSYHLLYHNERHAVEVHWNLVKMYFTIPPDFWWDDATTSAFAGVAFTTLAAEKYLLYTVFRLFNHGFVPLKFLVLVAELINRHRHEIDWNKLLTYSRQYRMERLVRFVLRLAHDALGATIPASLLHRKIAGYAWLERLVLSASWASTPRPYLRKVVYTSLLESPSDMLTALCRRLFPGPGEIRLRYRLPENSKRTYLYYALNPFLVFGRRRGDEGKVK